MPLRRRHPRGILDPGTSGGTASQGPHSALVQLGPGVKFLVDSPELGWTAGAEAWTSALAGELCGRAPGDE